MEIYFIAYYNSFRGDKNGYNLTRGGEGMVGFKHSPESIEKIINNRRSFKGKNNPAYGKSYAGWHHTEKNKIIMSDAKRGEKNPNFGKKLSVETLRKRSKSISGDKNWRWARKNFNASSIYYGVSITRFYHKDKIYIWWHVEINENGKKINLGIYKIEIEAAKIYDKYVVEHDINRPLNFPRDYPDYPKFIKKKK
jgi:hypothetical protein